MHTTNLYMPARGRITQTITLAGAFLLVLTAVMALIYFIQAAWMNASVAPSHSSVQLTDAPKITTITRDHVFDLSGSEASGYSDPMKLFDENCDPKYNGAFTPSTSPLPSRMPDLFTKNGKGIRIVIDLQAVHGLTELYWYEHSFESDSIWFYTGDMQHWKLAVSYKTQSPVTWGWKQFVLNTDTRYVMVRFNSYKSVISEMVLYGTAKEKIVPATMVAVKREAPTMQQFAGTNSYDYVQTPLMLPFGQVRLYQMLSWFDTDGESAYPNNKISLNHFNLPREQQLRYYTDSIRKMGNQLWVSIRGLPAFMENKGYKEKDKPVTHPGMDTEDPMSYGRHAKTLWTMAAMFGKTSVDTSLLDVKDVTKFSGLGLMDRYENGNEEDAYWTPYYWTPVDYFAMSSADYDGHEGKLGAKHGIKNADKNAKLLMSGMIQLDTSRVRTLKFLCEQLRSDKQFIWQGGVQYHYYSNDAVDNTKPPTKGISPEEDHMREKLARVKAFHDKLLPGVPLILGENGYDRSQQSWQRTPVIPGYSAAQSQGIMVIRSAIACFMAGFDQYNQYMMRNATVYEDAPGPYATSGMIGGPGTNTIYPLWYYWSAMVKQLGAYTPDKIVSESGEVWVYRLKQKDNPKKFAYILFSPTSNGHAVKNYRLKLEGDQNQLFTETRLDEKSVTGDSKAVKPTGGFIQLDVSESPVFLTAY